MTNDVRSYARLWPLAFAAVGVAGLGYAAWQWLRTDAQPIDLPDDDPPIQAPAQNEHIEKVREHFVDQYSTYAGVVSAGSPVVLRMPEGYRVPVVKNWHEPGDFVKKGDKLQSYDRPQIERAIEKAKTDGKTDDERRFRSFLELADLKAPFDCVVVSVDRTLGEVPLDEGIGVMTIADPAAFSFVVAVPGEVQRAQMSIGKTFQVELDADKGTVKGSVAEFRPASGTDVPVVLSLEPHEGIEDRLAGTVRVASGQSEAGLVPKTAVVKRGDVPVVRSWDQASRSFTERTVKLGETIGDDVVVLAGVFKGDSVLAPGPAPK